VRLNKLTISEFATIANNYSLTINWVSCFISRPKLIAEVIKKTMILVTENWWLDSRYLFWRHPASSIFFIN